MATPQVRLFGQPRWTSGSRDAAFPRGARGGLLIHLAYRQEWVERSELAFLFWPGHGDEPARANLRQLLRRTRSLEAGIVSEGDRVRWRVDSDVALFRAALGRRDWEAALALQPAELCADFVGPDGTGFEAWVELEREALARAWRRAARERAAELEAADDLAGAASLWRRLLDLDPLAEDVLQALLALSGRRGERSEGLRIFERFARRLESELGLEPLARTTALAEALRRGEDPPTRGGGAPGETTLPPMLLRPPRLIGRDRDVAAARAADSAVVLLAGEAGVGKSRLLQELAPGAPTLRGREQRESQPFHPLLPLLAELARRPGAFDHLGHYREDLYRFLPSLGHAPPAPDPLTVRLRLLEAMARVLERAAGANAVVVFDDLHWADEASLELLLLLAERGRVRTFGAFRSHDVGEALAATLRGLRQSGHVRVLQLAPLDEVELRTLLAQLSGSERGPVRFAGWLHRRSGGNPMFALETLKMLFERGDLRSDEDGWHTPIDDVTRDYEELAVPERIGQLVAQRSARLDEVCGRVLEVAAVLGGAGDPDRLGEVAGLSTWSVLEASERIEANGLLVGGAFQHDLIREAVYRGIEPDRVRRYHLRAAEGAGDDRTLEVAEHLWRGGDLERAVVAWQRGAAAMARRGLQAQTVPILRRALAATATPAQRRRLELELALVLKDLGEIAEARSLLAPMIDREHALEPKLRPALLEGWSALLEASGRRDEIPAVLARAVEASPPGERSEGLRVKLAFYRDDLDEAHRLLRTRLDRGVSDDGERLSLLTDLGGVLDNLERFDEGAEMHLQAIRLARRLGARFQLAHATANYLHNRNLCGRPEDALELAEDALAAADFDTTVLRNNLLAACLRLGDDLRAEHHARILVADAADPNFRGAARTRLARILRRLGRDEEAARELDLALGDLAAMNVDAALARVAVDLLELGGDRHREAAREVAARVLAGGRLRASFRDRVELALARSAD